MAFGEAWIEKSILEIYKDDITRFRILLSMDEDLEPPLETLENGGGMAMLAIKAGEMTDEQLHKYIRHPQYTARSYFAPQIVQRGEGMVLELLADKDARLRRLNDLFSFLFRCDH